MYLSVSGLPVQAAGSPSWSSAVEEGGKNGALWDAGELSEPLSCFMGCAQGNLKHKCFKEVTVSSIILETLQPFLEHSKERVPLLALGNASEAFEEQL